MSTKNKVIGVRVDAEMQARLAKFEQVTKVDAVTLIRAATEAALNYFEESGSMRFPLTMRPIDEASKKGSVAKS